MQLSIKFYEVLKQLKYYLMWTTILFLNSVKNSCPHFMAWYQTSTKIYMLVTTFITCCSNFCIWQNVKNVQCSMTLLPYDLQIFMRGNVTSQLNISLTCRKPTTIVPCGFLPLHSIILINFCSTLFLLCIYWKGMGTLQPQYYATKSLNHT